MERLYTIEEARDALPRVIAIVQRVREAYVALRRIQATVTAQQRGVVGDGHFVDANPWAGDDEDDGGNAHADTLESGARELDALGVEIKDIERGLFDFRSLRDGEVVYLCYMLGEPELAYWHRVEDGFAGRRPL
jgi:hypothetical protein